MVDWGLGSEGGGACARVRVCVCVRMRVGGGAWRCVCACTCACAWTCACVVCPFVKDVCVFHVSWFNMSGCGGCKRAVGQQWGPHCLKHRAKALV